MEKPEPKLVVNPTLGPEELLEELAARLQQLYGSLDTLAVRTENDGLELIYDSLWAMLEDVYQIQSLRDALEDRLGGAGTAMFPGDGRDMRH
ncbi:hypothetical protein F3N42_08195 [Marinihelvus fidelis]|uniref:Nucleotide pyrophosphohydrolase n=1 Tax=Marinihelvus fidelis TaxID=2613842 RepID=A0A5N0TAX4_9GAMM|nr:hypothetical protein [Marinihelvus fidelis]KAA9131297.1 hypothetical protein F3N42_08195 [Marinihelvus fidelis]